MQFVPVSAQRADSEVARLRSVGLGQWNFVCVEPVAFEPVELACRFQEDVDDDVVVVEHYPVAMRETFNRKRTLTLAIHSFFDSARDRLDLGV